MEEAAEEEDDGEGPSNGQVIKERVTVHCDWMNVLKHMDHLQGSPVLERYAK